MTSPLGLIEFNNHTLSMNFILGEVIYRLFSLYVNDFDLAIPFKNALGFYIYSLKYMCVLLDFCPGYWRMDSYFVF